MKTFEIYFDDLSEECQERFKEEGFWHDNIDLAPLAIFEEEDEEEIELPITYKELAIKMGGTGNFSGDIEHIDCNAKVLKDLAKEYPAMFGMEDNQNASPTVGEFLEGASDKDTLLAYVVCDTRDDKRISIEGIITQSLDVKEHFLQSRPDEYDKEGKGWRLWWD